MSEINNTLSNTLLTGTSGDDSIQNGGYWSDSSHYGGSNVTINAGAGNDSVYNSGDSVTINTGKGNDSVNNLGSSVTINTGDGNDSVIVNGSGTIGSFISVNADSGNDYISIYNDNITIVGGTGNDTVDNTSSDWGNNVLFKYAEGDGNDIIYGFKDNSTLSIGGGSYSSEKIGDDIIFTVGNGKISLIGAASLSAVNIVGEETPTETNSWKISGSKATYGTSSKTLFTVNGVKATKGLSLSNKTVTVSNSSLNKKTVTISSGYTLKLGSDVTKSTSTAAKWTISGTTATYKTKSTTAGYKLSDNKISYVKASGGEILITVSGVKSLSGLSLKNKTVTVSNASLNKKTVTISDGYSLKLGSDVAKSKITAKSWSISGSTATYKSGKTTAGYKLADNKISYVKSSGGSTLTTVKGVKSTSGLSVNDNTVTVSNSSLNKKTVTISSGYSLKLGSDVEKSKNTAAKWSISGSTATYKSSKTTAGYKLADNKISYVEAKSAKNLFKINGIKLKSNNLSVSGNITSGTAKYTISGNNVIFTVGGGKITVKGAADKNFTYTDASGEHFYAPEDDNPYKIDGKLISLTSSYTDKQFDVSTISGGSKIVTIDASAVTYGVEIIGNAQKNNIIGGAGNDTLEGDKGNDTLKGDAGSDIFVYYDGLGNDFIADYTVDDKIQIATGTISTVKASGKDVIFTVGYGSIKVLNAVKKGITYINADDFERYSFGGKETVTLSGTTAKITDKYWKNTFDVSKFAKNVKQIDASDVTRNITLNGNSKSNIINVGTGNNTIFGGAGNDSIYGGDGSNVFVYNKGDGNDRIYNFGNSDKLSITSGTVNVTANGNDVVFTVDKGKITLVGAVNREINYIENGNLRTTLFSGVNSDDLIVDDDFIVTDNDLSSLVRDGAANSYSTTRFDDKFTFTAEKSSLPALTYSSKK